MATTDHKEITDQKEISLKELEKVEGQFTDPQLEWLKSEGHRVVVIGEKHFALRKPNRHKLNKANDLMLSKGFSYRNEELVKSCLINDIKSYHSDDKVYFALNNAVQEITEETKHSFLF